MLPQWDLQHKATYSERSEPWEVRRAKAIRFVIKERRWQEALMMGQTAKNIDFTA